MVRLYLDKPAEIDLVGWRRTKVEFPVQFLQAAQGPAVDLTGYVFHLFAKRKHSDQHADAVDEWHVDEVDLSDGKVTFYLTESESEDIELYPVSGPRVWQLYWIDSLGVVKLKAFGKLSLIY